MSLSVISRLLGNSTKKATLDQKMSPINAQAEEWANHIYKIDQYFVNQILKNKNLVTVEQWLGHLKDAIDYMQKNLPLSRLKTGEIVVNLYDSRINEIAGYVGTGKYLINEISAEAGADKSVLRVLCKVGFSSLQDLTTYTSLSQWVHSMESLISRTLGRSQVADEKVDSSKAPQPNC